MDSLSARKEQEQDMECEEGEIVDQIYEVITKEKIITKSNL
jgi:hypothetical protein